jgi:hypothetical protein
MDKYDEEIGELPQLNYQTSSSKKRQKNRKKAEKQLKNK